jgi:hypothetical protein
MISEAKQASNQANAQHSTGPKTAPQPNRDRDGAGSDARSAANSRKHGLCSEDILVAGEDREEFEIMQVKLQIDICPRGALEKTLFDHLVIAGWQLRRIGRMETELSAGHASYTALLEDETLQKKLDRLARHHTRFQRTFHRCLKELKALQINRAQIEAVPLQERFEHPPLAPLKKISKRTQPPAEPDHPILTTQ